MKKLFNHTKKPVQDLDGYEESEYDWDGAGEEAYRADQDASGGWQEFYEEDVEGEGDDAGGYYAAADANYAEDSQYNTDVIHDDEFYNMNDEEDAYLAQNTGRRKKAAIWGKIGSIISDMSAMDRVIAATGVGVLILAIVVGSMFISSRIVDKQVSGFVSVGTQLEGIDTIGGAGLLAVADAQMAKFAAFSVFDDDEEYGYDEEDYNAEVTVALELVSIQKDLKIKFVNKKTNRLIANVPFAVNVTDPDGKTTIWSDDDMDGIIYKKDITPGDYKVVMEPLSDEKYARYIISTVSESVEVLKTIKYEKVNVANEVKTEKEIDASQEDTKINETVVESSLKDTVAWVESKVISAGYNEVSKDTITNPTQMVSLDKTFMRATEESSSEASESDDASSESGGTGSDSSESESTEGSDNETTEPSASPDPPASTPEITALALSPAPLTLVVGKEQTVQATATVKNQPANTPVKYSIAGDSSIATATIGETSGLIKVTGVKAGTASFTVTAACGTATKSATLQVTVVSQKSMTLDKTTATVFTEETVIVNATIANAGTQDPTVTATSSDTGIAKVSVNKKAVTITGVKAGQATITVSFTENNETVEAKCVVTVKSNPKNDTTTLLKDKNGKQVYVLDNGSYREAHYADYYTASKFYLMGEAKYTGWQTIDGKVYFFTAEGKKVTGEQVIQGAKYNFASDGSLVTGSGALGIDVSKWNGDIDWNAVKNSGINYVIIRCGYRGSSAGSLVVDPKFTANIKGATAAGIKVGVYFFTQAIDEREAVEEASMVLDQIKNYKISYPVFLDVESSGGRADNISNATRTAVCKAFCQTIQNAGYNAGIYANKSWLTTKLDPSALSAYKIWLAQYAATPTYTGRYDLWQYRSTGSVSGISGNVDMNLSYLGY